MSRASRAARLSTKANAESEAITHAANVAVRQDHEASDSVVASMANAGVRQQSVDIAQAIAAANSELHTK